MAQESEKTNFEPGDRVIKLWMYSKAEIGTVVSPLGVLLDKEDFNGSIFSTDRCIPLTDLTKMVCLDN